MPMEAAGFGNLHFQKAAVTKSQQSLRTQPHLQVPYFSCCSCFKFVMVPGMKYKRQNGKRAELMLLESALWKRGFSCIQRHAWLQGKDREITLGGREEEGADELLLT